MPHVIVKLWPGKSERQKARLAGRIADDVMEVLNYGEESVSVGFEEIKSGTGKTGSTSPTSRTSGKSSTRSRDMKCE